MPVVYDNWERLVAAVVKREQIWQLCHQDSISTICSESSDFSLSFRLSDDGSDFSLIDAFEGVQQLGKGTFLTHLLQDITVSDQKVLARGTKVVVKLLEKVRLKPAEYQQQMIAFENCSHENVAVPRAFNISNTGNTNFVVYDYYTRGSVLQMLPLSKARYAGFDSRISLVSRIAVGAARGIAHIHTQCEGKLAHGNIKPSNILLNSQHYGCVCDFSLAGAMRSPEETRWQWYRYHASDEEFMNPSQEGDVYSFGVVLLELLNCKSTMHINGVSWFRSRRRSSFNVTSNRLIVDEMEMFDSVEDEVFQVAMKCLSELARDRPKMCDVVLMLEKIPCISEVMGYSWKS